MLIGESRYEKLNDRNQQADRRRRGGPRMQAPEPKATLKVKAGPTPMTVLFDMAIPAEGPDGFVWTHGTFGPDGRHPICAPLRR